MKPDPYPRSDEVKLYDRADGVRGHFCIGFEQMAVFTP